MPPCAAVRGHCARSARCGAPRCQLCGLLALQRDLQHQPVLQAVRPDFGRPAPKRPPTRCLCAPLSCFQSTVLFHGTVIARMQLTPAF